MSNFSSNHLYLRWETSGQNTLLAYYRVIINGHQQQTLSNIPEIHWTKQLLPGRIYNVSIIAVCYSYDIDGAFGYTESEPYTDWIEIVKGIFFIQNGVRSVSFSGFSF